jgi:hypothetical protein
LYILASRDFNQIILNMNDNKLIAANVYKDIFEPKFLGDTKDFYFQQIISYDEKEPIIVYLNQVRFIL